MCKWLDLDNYVGGICDRSEVVLAQEMDWARHLGLSAVLLPAPTNASGLTNYARCVAQQLTAGGVHERMQYWLRVPLLAPINYMTVRWPGLA